jgi:uncharacterized protein (UPF0335 family)
MILSVLSVLSASGQTPDGSYAARWKKIDQLINENGLTRSALAEVEKVYQLAKKEKKDVQIIKALIYMARLDDQLKEESDHGLNLLISELKTAKAPVKQLLHSMLAAKYQNYLEANRFRLYGRTPLNTTPGTDPDTWSLEELHHKISLHYQASLTQTDILKKTRLEPFDPIIVKGNSRTLRPTLFIALRSMIPKHLLPPANFQEQHSKQVIPVPSTTLPCAPISSCWHFTWQTRNPPHCWMQIWADWPSRTGRVFYRKKTVSTWKLWIKCRKTTLTIHSVSWPG